MLVRPIAPLSGVRRVFTAFALSKCAETLPVLVRPTAPLSGVRRDVRWVINSAFSRPFAPLSGARRGLTAPAPSKCAE